MTLLVTLTTDFTNLNLNIAPMKIKSLYLILSWYATTLTCLILALLLLVQVSIIHPQAPTLKSNYKMYQAQPASGDISQEVAIGKSDGRILIVSKFLKDHHSPLADYAKEFITEADRNHLDFRLMPAIAMQESRGGKILPPGSYNPFGYGIYGQKIMRFNSFEEAITKVALGLKNNYLDFGLKTPEQIMYKYTPSSPAKGGPWAFGVSAFMEQLI